MIDCSECGKPLKKGEKPRKMYKECKGKAWYTISDIRYCPLQVLWLIEEFFHLDGGGIYRCNIDWPDTEMAELPSIQRFAQTSAYFTKAIEVIAELAVRLKRLGRSGELLLAELQAGMEGNLTSEADAAFHYITGNRRKREPFYKWKSDRKRRRE